MDLGLSTEGNFFLSYPLDHEDQDLAGEEESFDPAQDLLDENGAVAEQEGVVEEEAVIEEEAVAEQETVASEDGETPSEQQSDGSSDESEDDSEDVR